MTLVAWGCRACGRVATSEADLLAQGCEGTHERLVPESALAKAQRERNRYLEALLVWPQDGSVHEPFCLGEDPGYDCDCYSSIVAAALTVPRDERA